MTKLLPLIVAIALYVSLQYVAYKRHRLDEENKYQPQLHSPLGALLFFCGVLRAIYLFDYNFLVTKFPELDFFLKVIAIISALECSCWVWGVVEAVFLDKLPSAVEAFGLTVTGIVREVVLFAFVFVFDYYVANNFDAIVANMMVSLGIGELDE